MWLNKQVVLHVESRINIIQDKQKIDPGWNSHEFVE